MYSPQLGRFLNPDPLTRDPTLFYDNNAFGEALTRMQNAYVYCDNNPINYTDPSGMQVVAPLVPPPVVPPPTIPVPQIIVIGACTYAFYQVGQKVTKPVLVKLFCKIACTDEKPDEDNNCQTKYPNHDSCFSYSYKSFSEAKQSCFPSKTAKVAKQSPATECGAGGTHYNIK